jgi:hypothetical protein
MIPDCSSYFKTGKILLGAPIKHRGVKQRLHTRE